MSDKKLLIRMNILQLQQMSFLICLSEKLNLIMLKSGMSEADINEINEIEKRLNEEGLKKMMSDWNEELKELTK